MNWTEQEREAAEEAPRRDVHRLALGPSPEDGTDEQGYVLRIADRVLTALAPFVAERERQAAAKALRDAEADYSHLYLTRGPAAKAVAAVTCADLRERADAIEAQS